jgi:acetyl/propionyl-CoA carboxylase alpha subunit
MQVRPGPLQPRGWAIECRITSEDPGNGFLPSTGRIQYLRAPAGPGIRWDSGIETGDEVTLYYDSLLAKLIAWAPDRAQALGRMKQGLDELVIVGVATNQAFHRRLMSDPSFREGAIDIQFLERRTDLLSPGTSPERIRDMAVAAALAEDEARQSRRPASITDGAAGGEWARQARSEGLR